MVGHHRGDRVADAGEERVRPAWGGKPFWLTMLRHPTAVGRSRVLPLSWPAASGRDPLGECEAFVEAAQPLRRGPAAVGPCAVHAHRQSMDAGRVRRPGGPRAQLTWIDSRAASTSF